MAGNKEWFDVNEWVKGKSPDLLPHYGMIQDGDTYLGSDLFVLRHTQFLNETFFAKRVVERVDTLENNILYRVKGVNLCIEVVQHDDGELVLRIFLGD